MTIDFERDLSGRRNLDRYMPHRTLVRGNPDAALAILGYRVYSVSGQRLCLSRVNGRQYVTAELQQFLDPTFVCSRPQITSAIDKHSVRRFWINRRKCRRAVV